MRLAARIGVSISIAWGRWSLNGTRLIRRTAVSFKSTRRAVVMSSAFGEPWATTQADILPTGVQNQHMTVRKAAADSVLRGLWPGDTAPRRLYGSGGTAVGYLGRYPRSLGRTYTRITDPVEPNSAYTLSMSISSSTGVQSLKFALYSPNVPYSKFELGAVAANTPVTLAATVTTTGADAAATHLALLSEDLQVGEKLDIEWIQLEAGSEARPYLPSRHEILERIAKTETELTIANGQIALKVSSQDFEQVTNQLEGEITDVNTQLTVSNAAFTVALEAIDARVDQVDITVNQTVAGQITDITESVGELTVALGGINASVSSINTSISGLDQRVTSNAAAINLVPDQISLAVSNYDTEIADGKFATQTQLSVTSQAITASFASNFDVVDGQYLSKALSVTNKTVIDATGVKIYNGALQVLNASGEVVIDADSAGSLLVTGQLRTGLSGSARVETVGSELNGYSANDYNTVKIGTGIYGAQSDDDGAITLYKSGVEALRIYPGYENPGAQSAMAITAVGADTGLYVGSDTDFGSFLYINPAGFASLTGRTSATLSLAYEQTFINLAVGAEAISIQTPRNIGIYGAAVTVTNL